MTVGSAAQAPPGSLWWHRDFRLLWGGQSVSVTGGQVGTIAVPLLALTVLEASTFQVALLTAAARTPPLLVGLHSGVLADRYRKRPLMIGCDLFNTLVLALVPAAAWAGWLTLPLLYAVVFATGCANVISFTACLSYLPALLDRDRLREANSKLGATNSLADLAGANLGGALVALFGPVRTMLADALSYAFNAGCLLALRAPEPAHAPRQPRSSTLREIREGWRYCQGHAVIRPLMWTNATTTWVLAGMNALWITFLVRELHWSPTALGVVLGMTGVGGFTGALLSSRLADWFGVRRTMLVTLGFAPVCELPLVLARPGALSQYAIGTALVVQVGCAVIYGTLQRSIRQEACEPALQGRMQATGRWLAAGPQPLLALLAGGIAEVTGIRTVLAACTLLLALPVLTLWRALCAHPAQQDLALTWEAL